jgi:hypothetical protein
MGFHFIQAFAIMILLPVICILIDYYSDRKKEKLFLIAKWVLFWSVGIRSFTAGLVQLLNPSYTAEVIFHLSGSEFYIFIRELGVANIAIGLAAIISYKLNNWRVPVAFISLIFNLFLSINHIINFQAGFNQAVSLTGDLLIVIVLSIFLVNSYKAIRNERVYINEQKV